MKGTKQERAAIVYGHVADDDEEELPKHKRCELIFFMFLMGMGAMSNGYGTSSANQVADTLNEKYGWTTDKEKSLH